MVRYHSLTWHLYDDHPVLHRTAYSYLTHIEHVRLPRENVRCLKSDVGMTWSVALHQEDAEDARCFNHIISEDIVIRAPGVPSRRARDNCLAIASITAALGNRLIFVSIGNVLAVVAIGHHASQV